VTTETVNPVVFAGGVGGLLDVQLNVLITSTTSINENSN